MGDIGRNQDRIAPCKLVGVSWRPRCAAAVSTARTLSRRFALPIDYSTDPPLSDDGHDLLSVPVNC